MESAEVVVGGNANVLKTDDTVTGEKRLDVCNNFIEAGSDATREREAARVDVVGDH